MIPAGPLREPVGVGLKRADVILSIGPQKAQANFIETWGAAIGGLAHVQGQLRPLQTGLSLQNRPVIAFAGIGYPEKFFATLKDMRADIRATHALADHQPLSPALMARLLREARSMGAQIITTEKDAVRLPPAFRGDVMTIPVRLEIDDWAILDDALKRVTNTRDEGSRN